MVDVTIPSDSNIRKWEHKRYQGLKKELERMRDIKASVVAMVIGEPEVVNHKLGKQLQQIPGTISEISVQRSDCAGLCRTPQITGRLQA